MKYSLKKPAALLALHLFALSVGFSFASRVYAADNLAAQVAPSDDVMLAEGNVVRLDEEGLSDRIQGTGDISHEYTFSGNENEIVVVYWESLNGSKIHDLGPAMFDLAGQAVTQDYYYMKGVNLDEMSGTHRIFRLPKTGEYRLTFGINSSITDPTLIESGLRDYAFKLRVAPYFERLMLHAHDLFEAKDYEALLSVSTMAIAENPEHPMSYFLRVFAFSSLAMDNQDAAFATRAGMEPFPTMYELFQSLSLEEQQRVISDLMQAEAGYVDAIEQGTVTAESLGFDPLLLGAAAEFVQTGIPSDELSAFVEGIM